MGTGFGLSKGKSHSRRALAPELCLAIPHTSSSPGEDPVIHAEVKFADTRWLARKLRRCMFERGKKNSEAKRRQTQLSYAAPAGTAAHP
jgi:hypothetical protein